MIRWQGRSAGARWLGCCISGWLSLCSNSIQAQKPVRDSFDFYTADHVRIPVRMAGHGPYCLFVPGGPGGGYRSFADLGGKRLENCLTMVYMDQRGSGSATNAKDYSLTRLLADMEALRKQLGIQRWYVMSHSFGGVLAVNYAHRFPSHVEGLVFVNATLHFLNPASTKEQLHYGYGLLGIDTAFQSNDPTVLFRQTNVLHQALSRHKIGYRLLTDSLSTIVALDRLDSLYPRTNDFAYAVLAPLLQTNANKTYSEYFTDYTTLTARIQARTLVITGDQDYAVGIHHYLSFHFPHQQIARLHGGHLLYAERNLVFAQTVCAFIQQRSIQRKN